MKSRTLIAVLVLTLVGFLLLIGGVVLKIALGIMTESGVIHPRPALDGLTTILVLIGVLGFFTGSIGMALSAGWYYLSYSPKRAFTHIMNSEYARFLESHALTEGKARSIQGECVLEGIVDETPVIVSLTHRHTRPFGPFFVHRRTTFFSPFPESHPSPFRVLPTGKKRGKLGTISETFARCYSLPSQEEREAFIHSGIDEGVMSAVLDFTGKHDGTFSIGYEGVWWAADRLDFGGGAEDILSEFISTVRLITGAVAAGARDAQDAVGKSPASHPAGPPVYVSMRALSILFPILLVLGVGCIFLGWKCYPELMDTARIFVITGLFLSAPGLIGTPLALIYRLRSRPAGRR
ncbi:MAG: hypothetical protein JW885_05625 [Deltaproteobacteria bacterium]|nr:hypothetical protein [Candidatus Zymogenaceae bacterium]